MSRIALCDGVMPLAVGLLIAMATLFAQDTPAVPHPDGFRSWTHVKSLIVGPGHESFPTYHQPAIQQVIANGARWAAPQAIETGPFPNVKVAPREPIG